MKTARAKEELELFNAIEASLTDEGSFYALCEYFDFLQDDYEVLRLLKRSFEGKGNNIYLSAGETLFNRVESRKQTPSAVWGDVLGNVTGRDNKSLVMFSKTGMSASVARTVHQLISKVDETDQIPTLAATTTVCINDKLHFSVKGHENRPFYRPKKGGEPYKIISILVERYLNRAEPISSGALSKKIYGTSTKANHISSVVNLLRKNQFKKKLKQELISNSSGYYLNDDFLSIEII